MLINRVIFVAIVCLIVLPMCNKNEEELNSGHLSIDGTRFTLNRSGIFPALDPTEDHTGNGFYLTEAAVSGPNGTTFLVEVCTQTQALSTGTYIFTDKAMQYDRDPMEINYFGVAYAGNSLTASKTTVGTFQVERKGDVYTFTLDAIIDGHEVKAYFKGEPVIFSPT